MTVTGSTGRRAVLPALVAALAFLGALAPRAGAAASPRLHLTVTLRPREPAALARYAAAVSTPGSTAYHDYLTPRQFGARFGASTSRIDAVTAALRSRGLDPGQASAGGLSIPLSATAAQLRAGGGADSAVARALSRADRTAVQSVISFGRAAAPTPLAVRPARRPPRGAALGALVGAGAATSGFARSAATPAGPQACADVATDAARAHAYPDQVIADSYGFDALYAAGDEGAGTTIAVYELEPDDPADIAAFQSCYDTHTQISYIRVDGGAGRGPGSDEAALDIETLIGFAPQARLLVYQGPNAQTGLPGSGPYEVYSEIVNQDRAQVISVSWGQCEQQLGIPAE
jgi:subtilase family serine protease